MSIISLFSRNFIIALMQRINLIKRQLLSNLDDTQIAIVAYTRTPICKGKNGSLTGVPPDVLLASVIKELLIKSNLVVENDSKSSPYKIKENCRIDEVYINNFFQPVSIFNIGYLSLTQVLGEAALQIPLASSINIFCCGLRSIQNLFLAIKSGQLNLGLVFGVESNTTFTKQNKFEKKYISQHALENESAYRYVVPYGVQAELINQTHNITRQDLEEFTLESYLKAKKAAVNRLNNYEISQLQLNKTEIANGVYQDITHSVKEDDFLKHEISLESLQKLRPYFIMGRTYTTGTISHLSDGAGGLCVSNLAYAQKHKLPIKALILGIRYGFNQKNPELSQASAISTVLNDFKLTLNDIDIFELNESFSGIAVIISRTLGIPKHKVNPYGGSLAYGEAISMLDLRQVMTCSTYLTNSKKRYGIVSTSLSLYNGVSCLIENKEYNYSDN